MARASVAGIPVSPWDNAPSARQVPSEQPRRTSDALRPLSRAVPTPGDRPTLLTRPPQVLGFRRLDAILRRTSRSAAYSRYRGTFDANFGALLIAQPDRVDRQGAQGHPDRDLACRRSRGRWTRR